MTDLQARLLAVGVYVASFGGWHILGKMGVRMDVAVPVILCLLASGLIWYKQKD